MVNYKKIAFVLVALAMSLAVGYLALASTWIDAPAGTPPTCPAGAPGCDRPLNVGATTQTKAGALTINADLTANRLLDSANNAWFVDPANSGIAGVFAGNVGIGTTGPTQRLDVDGQIRIRGGGPAAGEFLRAAADGTATWEPITGALPTGTSGQTLRHDGTTWVANSNLFNNGTNVGIGTATPGARLEVFGTPGTQRITTIPAGTTGTYTLSWDALQICQFGTCSTPWRDLDGDGRTYQARTDCDEGCPTCFADSTATTTTVDGRDQNCNGQIDESAPPTHTTTIVHNNGTGTSCNTVCATAGGSCISIGINSEATDTQFFLYFFSAYPEPHGSCQTTDEHWGNCDTIMTPPLHGHACDQNRRRTNCRCQLTWPNFR